MNNADQKITDRVRKLIELARGGVDGEKRNAQQILDAMLKKHGLSMSDFEDEETKDYEVKYKGDFEESLIYQLLAKILDTTNPTTKRLKRSRRAVCFVTLTRVQWAEFDYLYEIYRRALAKHLDASFYAFVAKNQLTSNQKTGESNLNMDDLAQIMKIARNMDPVNVAKALPAARLTNNEIDAVSR